MFKVLGLFGVTAQAFRGNFKGVGIVGQFHKIFMFRHLLQMAVGTYLRATPLFFMAADATLMVGGLEPETLRKIGIKGVLMTRTAAYQFGIGTVGHILLRAFVMTYAAVIHTRSVLSVIKTHPCIAILAFSKNRTVEEKIGLPYILHGQPHAVQALGTP
jgi:hypothetical protein